VPSLPTLPPNDTNSLNRALGLDAPGLLGRADALSTDRTGAANNAILECWIENALNSFSSDRREFAVSKIFIRCPQAGKAALDTGAFAGLLPIALPLWCPAYNQMVSRTPGPQTVPSAAGAKT
jgi:hypothetical protein